MKLLPSILAITLSINTLCAQNSFYDRLPWGSFYSGFCDTILLNPDITYQQYNYSGPLPLFVKIWHPIKVSTQQELTFGDFGKQNVPTAMDEIYNELIKKSETEFIDYNITYSLPDEHEIDYGLFSHRQVLDSIKNFKTVSVKSRINVDNEFPVIVYHHGAQSVAEENFIMAEYFASKGFIFVSANFHLPYSNMPYGSAPFMSDQVFKNDQSNLTLLTQFAKSLSTKNQTIFIGHSWGAQSGWGLLHDSTIADVFVSLETTLEDKTDSIFLKERWPELYQLIQIEKTDYSLPVLLLAGNDQPVPFPFFKQATSPLMIHASTRDYFTHNSFTSTFLMRYFLYHSFPQPDTQILSSQITIYTTQLQFIEQFIYSVFNHQPFELTPFNEQFYIHSSN